METKPTSPTEDSVDTSFVDLAEGKLGQAPQNVELKTETPVTLDVKYAAPVAPEPRPEDLARTQEILKDITDKAEQVLAAPEKPTIESISTQESGSVEKTPVQTENKSDVAYNELLERYPDIAGQNFGVVRDTIKYSNSENQISGGEAMLYSTFAAFSAFFAANATAIPGLITELAYGGGAGTLTAVGGVGAAIVGAAPVIAVGATAYGAYKLFKNIRGRMRISNDLKKARTAFGLPEEA